MSAAIAARERRPIVPGTPQIIGERRAELAEIERELQVINLLTGWRVAVQHPIIADDHESTAYLLELNVEKRQLGMRPFKKHEMMEAHASYLAREKATEDDANVQVVLVSADSVANLKRAYPNFYVDTTAFIDAIRQETY